MQRRSIHLTLLCLTVIKRSTTIDCPPCQCAEGYTEIFADCSGLGLDAVPTDALRVVETSVRKIVSLDLSGNNIKLVNKRHYDVALNNFKAFQNLRYLNLAENNLQTLNSDGLNAKLKRLNITGNPNLKLAKNAFKNTQLTELYGLSTDQFDASTFKTSKLRHLSINFTGDQFSKLMFRDFFLQSLDMTASGISEIPAKLFAPLKAYLKTMRLHFAAKFQIPANVFAELDNLESLTLSCIHCSVSENAFNNLRLEKLKLSNVNIIHETTLEPLSKTLQSLELNNAAFVVSSDQKTEIPENLFQNLTRIKEIRVYNNYLSRITDQTLENNLILDTLLLNSVGLIDVSANAFQKNHQLRSLSLANNKLKRLSSINDLTNLEFLNLSHNYLTRTPAIESYNSLTTLDITDNLISKPEINAFRNLKSFHASDNVITEVGRANFESVPDLRIIDLSLNKIERIGAETFDSTPNVRVINVTGNSLTCSSRVETAPWFGSLVGYSCALPFNDSDIHTITTKQHDEIQRNWVIIAVVFSVVIIGALSFGVAYVLWKSERMARKELQRNGSAVPCDVGAESVSQFCGADQTDNGTDDTSSYIPLRTIGTSPTRRASPTHNVTPRQLDIGRKTLRDAILAGPTIISTSPKVVPKPNEIVSIQCFDEKDQKRVWKRTTECDEDDDNYTTINLAYDVDDQGNACENV